MKAGVLQRDLPWSYYFNLDIVDGKRKKKVVSGLKGMWTLSEQEYKSFYNGIKKFIDFELYKLNDEVK